MGVDVLANRHIILKGQPLQKLGILQLPVGPELCETLRLSTLEELLHSRANEIETFLFCLIIAHNDPIFVDTLEAIHALLNKAAADGVPLFVESSRQISIDVHQGASHAVKEDKISHVIRLHHLPKQADALKFLRQDVDAELICFVVLLIGIRPVVASVVVVHVLTRALVEPVDVVIYLIDPVAVIVLIRVQIENVTLKFICQDKQFDDALDSDSFQRFEHREVYHSYLLPKKGKHHLLRNQLFLKLQSKNVLKPLEKLVLIVFLHRRLGHQNIPDFFNLFLKKLCF